MGLRDIVRLAGKPGSARRIRLRKVWLVFVQVLALCSTKTAVHFLGLERISVNQLFSAIVASTVFLLGFLLSGVLTDFKESEKIPGELATSLESLSLELKAITTYHPTAQISEALNSVAELGERIMAWLMERVEQDSLMACYRETHHQVVLAAVQFKGDASTLRGRLMQDLWIILQKINRIQIIRDTSFVPLVYWMAYAAASLLFAGLILSRSENLIESVFFLAVISFLVILLLRLIDDIDNPFGFSDNNSAEDVCIDLLQNTVNRLRDASDSR